MNNIDAKFKNLENLIIEFREDQNKRWDSNDQRWKENNERWNENDRRWKENNERWNENDQRWKENNERWNENDQRWKENNKRWERNEQLWKMNGQCWERNDRSLKKLEESQRRTGILQEQNSAHIKLMLEFLEETREASVRKEVFQPLHENHEHRISQLEYIVTKDKT